MSENEVKEASLVIIEWVDSSYSSAGVFSKKEVEKFTLITVKTIGWGIELEDRWNLYAEEFVEDGNYRHLTSIPKTGIVKVTLLLPGDQGTSLRGGREG